MVGISQSFMPELKSVVFSLPLSCMEDQKETYIDYCPVKRGPCQLMFLFWGFMRMFVGLSNYF